MSDLGRLPLVYVIILNWNLPFDTVKCVESVLASDYPNFRVLVVDNASTDDSVEIFKQRFNQKIEILVLDKNYGFGQGNNYGIRMAIQQNADYTLLLNNDTFVDATMISEMVSCARTDATIGIVGPLIFYADNPRSVWFSGMRFWKQLYVVQRGLHVSLNSNLNQRCEYVDFVSGCGMLVDRSLWMEVGFFSPEYYMYYEDLDLCLRSKKSGFKIVTSLKAQMWHKVSASSGGSLSPLKQYYQIKSSLIFYKRYTHGLWFWGNLCIRCMHAIVTSVRYMMRGTLNREMLRFYWAGIKEFFYEYDEPRD